MKKLMLTLLAVIAVTVLAQPDKTKPDKPDNGNVGGTNTVVNSLTKDGSAKAERPKPAVFHSPHHNLATVSIDTTATATTYAAITNLFAGDVPDMSNVHSIHIFFTNNTATVIIEKRQ